MKSLFSTMIAAAVPFCIVGIAFAADYVPLNQPGKDYAGKHAVPAKTTNKTLRLGTLLADGVIDVGNGCDGIDIIITSGSSDLEGTITIGDDCNDITIDISDSLDTSGNVVVGKNSRVKIKCGSDFRGTVKAGDKSRIRITTASDGKTDGTAIKDGGEVYVNDAAR